MFLMCSSCPYSPLMCSWLPERPWCLMQFYCPVVSIRIDFQRGVLKDMERLKAPVLLDGTCRVPLENQSASLICLARKSVAQPTAPRSKISCSAYCASLEKTHNLPYARPSPPALNLALTRLRRPSRVPLTLTLSRLHRSLRVLACA